MKDALIETGWGSEKRGEENKKQQHGVKWRLDRRQRVKEMKHWAEGMVRKATVSSCLGRKSTCKEAVEQKLTKTHNTYLLICCISVILDWNIYTEKILLLLSHVEFTKLNLFYPTSSNNGILIFKSEERDYIYYYRTFQISGYRIFSDVPWIFSFEVIIYKAYFLAHATEEYIRLLWYSVIK